VETQSNNQAARVFASAFAESLAQSLIQTLGTTWTLAVLDDPDLTTRQGQSVHFRLTVDGPLRGECFVELYESHVAELASKILGQPLAAYSNAHRDALEKVILSSMPGVSASLAARFGALTFKVNHVEGLAFGGMFVVPLSASGGEQTDIPVLLYFDSPLLAALSLQQPAGNASEAGGRPFDPSNLKLVMDVELNVSLRFGQRQLPLREVLELASGSVVELDRQVDDPVELLLDGKVIARGEAVIVDGNYGLRVTEIPQPMASHFVR